MNESMIVPIGSAVSVYMGWLAGVLPNLPYYLYEPLSALLATVIGYKVYHYFQKDEIKGDWKMPLKAGAMSGAFVLLGQFIATSFTGLPGRAIVALMAFLGAHFGLSGVLNPFSGSG